MENSSSQYITRADRKAHRTNEFAVKYEHRQKTLGVRTTPTVWTSPHLLYWRGRQLYVFVTLETAIHIIVLGDNLQFNIMEYGTTPYVGMTLASPLK